MEKAALSFFFPNKSISDFIITQNSPAEDFRALADVCGDAYPGNRSSNHNDTTNMPRRLRGLGLKSPADHQP